MSHGNETARSMDGSYDSANDARRSYDHAIRSIRLDGVKAGRFLPDPDDPAEIKASPIVEDARRIGPAVLYRGDSTRIVAYLAGIDACVTDPPYELGFMGKGWDSTGVAADWRTWGGVRIALKPGGHLLAFAGSRTYHRIASAIDDAGFEVRDQVMWIYGSGFPKSLNIEKAINKIDGIEFDEVPASGVGFMNAEGEGGYNVTKNQLVQKGESSKRAKQWEGWGTALKPAHEPVCVARKPLSEGTVAANVLRWATGALNIDAGRVGSSDGYTENVVTQGINTARTSYAHASARRTFEPSSNGRWPANVAHDGSFGVLEAFPPSARDAMRFFYSAKADREERESGLSPTAAVTERSDAASRDGGRGGGTRANIHPTVKPVDLMRWLCRLVTPPGGVVLDPFMGSGSTGIGALREGFRFVGIEQSQEYFDIACARIAEAQRVIEAEPDLVREITKATRAMAQRVDADRGGLLDLMEAT